MATVNGNDNANILTGSASNDTLNGLGGNDKLYGNGGDDTLDGGTGNDLLVGGRGSDTYRFGQGYGFDVIDNSGGVNNDADTLLLTNLSANQIRLTRIGNDLVLSVLASGETLTVSQNFLDADHAIDRIQFADGSRWSASVMLANLYYPPVVPTDGADVINGNPTDDSLLGLGGDDTLYGNGGNDTLDGGSDNDRMEGGVGNDTYVVDAAGDVVVEANNAGDDLVQASINYTLGNNVERLTLTGSANINGVGNSLANTLIGNAGNNLLDGGAGTDSMAGGSGDDTYIVDKSGDSVSELADGGNDTVRVSLNYSLGANLENLELTGSSNLNGTGNALANRLTGNTGNNLLDGGAGDDFLAGRRGNDTYRYGTNYGNDVIDNSGGANADVDTVQLVGLNSNNLSFVHTGNDLQMVVLATSQTLTLKNFYLGTDYEIDQLRFGNNVVWNTAALKAAATSPANVAPSSTNDSQTTLEDTPVILGSADFGTYSDPESTPLAAVKITSLPLLGSLQYNNGSAWVAVVQDQVISKADLDAGKLQFVPALNGNGNGYVSIEFKVSDGTAFAVNANTLSINVTAVNDAPTGAVAISGNATVGQTLSASNSLADVDGLGIIGYQWQYSSDGNSWSAIASATDNTYTLSAAEVGQQVRVEARYIDDGGTAEVVASAATTAVAAQFNLIEGGAGDDPLTGTAAADRLLGHGGNDTLFGLAGDDELDGGAGNDWLDGGAGNDSAVYSANMNQYTVTFDPHGYLAVEVGAGSGEAGRDRINVVEQLRFADGTITVNGSPGGEVLVNSTTASDQYQPTISGLSDGGYVVSWMSNGQEGSGWGIYAQRYGADGTAVGDEVRVNSTTASDQYQPTISGLSDGGYVVSWMSYGQDGSGGGIYAQRYGAGGAAVGDEVRVNSTTLDTQQDPTISGLSDGGYVVSWTSFDQDGSGAGIYAQRYGAGGAAVGDEVRVNSTTASDQLYPSVAALADGGYVVSWMSYSQDGSGLDIYAQRYDAGGAAVGDEVRVNSTTANHQFYPSVAALADGGYVVSWTSYGQDGSGWDIYTQRYDAGGAAVGDEVRVSSTTFDIQQQPAISGLSDGGYVVSWTSYGQDGSGWDIYAQRYDASGAAVGDEVRVTSTTLDSQYEPTISGLSDGGYVVSWTSYGQDGSGSGIYAQRYDANGQTVANTLALAGDAGDNLVQLGSGDERIAGGGGNDTIFGGEGYDTALYQGSQPDFAFGVQGVDLISVNDLNPADGNEGLDTLHDVETLQFGDGVRLQALRGEVRVTSTTLDSQYEPTISGLSDGGYVVSWTSFDQDGSGAGIYAQRYGAGGAAEGDEVRVNSTTFDYQQQPTISGLSDGGYVVSWTSSSQDGSGYGIYAQRYDVSGAAVGDEVRVNSTTANYQYEPAISALSDGGYVVSWTSYGQDGSGSDIYTQRYDAGGAAVGDEVRVNSTTFDTQQQPAISGLSDGGYVVSWTSYGQDGSGWDIYAQRYDASGAAVGDEVRVNSTTASDQQQPTISGLSDGGYVVSWMSYGQDGSGSGIYSQRFDANGNPVLDHLEWTGDASANLISSTVETDWFSGGTGADTFQFAQLPGDRADLITDFTQGSDMLALNSGLFNLQGQTVAESLANVSGAQNEVAGAHLVFNQNDHTLYYDADGAANDNAVAVVTLTGVTTLTASDVQLYV